MATSSSALPITKLITPAVPQGSTTAATTPTTSTSGAATTPGGAIGETSFLSLLTTELANQNPLNPIDDTQSVAQLAQFSSLQATTNLADSFSAFQSNFAVSQASSLIGTNVTVATTDTSGNASTVSGTVSGIQIVNGTPQMTLTTASGTPIAGSNGQPITFTTSQITQITK